MIPAVIAGIASLLLARNLSLDDFGRWTFYLQAGAFAATIVAAPTAFWMATDQTLRGISKNRALGLLVAGSPVAALGAIISAALAGGMSGSQSLAAGILGPLLAVALSARAWFIGMMDALQRYRLKAVSLSGTAAAFLLSVLMIYEIGWSEFELTIVARILAVAIAIAIGWLAVSKSLSTDNTGLMNCIKSPLTSRSSWQISLNSLLNVSTLFAFVVVVGYLGGPEIVGVIGIGLLLGQSISLMAVGADAVMLPTAIRSVASSNPIGTVRAIGYGVSLVGAAIVVLIVVSGEWITSTLFDQQLTHEQNLLVLLVVTGIWLKQVASVELVVLRARQRHRPGLFAATVAAATLSITTVILSAFNQTDNTIAAGWGWVTSQAAVIFVAASVSTRSAVSR